MEKILNGNSILLFDEEDFLFIDGFNWTCNNSYVFRTMIKDGKRKRLYIHREIMNAPEGLVVDHINGNPLDNRKINLRICTQKENLRNRKKAKNAKSSKFKGVRSRKGKFEVSIGRGKSDYKYLGVYETELDAAIAYNIEASKRYGDYARLNDISFDYAEYKPKKYVGSSEYRGVSYSKTSDKWVVRLQVGKQRKRIGIFKCEISAAKAYNKAALDILGDKAKLNNF